MTPNQLVLLYFFVPVFVFVCYLFFNFFFVWSTQDDAKAFLEDFKNNPTGTTVPFIFLVILWPVVLIVAGIYGLSIVLPKLFIVLFPKSKNNNHNDPNV